MKRVKKKVAVVGGGIGGLVAAGELAVRGHHVTLFEAQAQVGGKAGSVRFGDLVFDKGPTLLTMPATVSRAFARLEALDLLPPAVELKEQCHYVFPDGKALRVCRDIGRTAEQVERLWPGEGKRVHKFYRTAASIYRHLGRPYLDVPYDSTAGFVQRILRQGPQAIWTGMQMGTLHQLAQKSFAVEALQHLVGRFATYAGASPYEAPAAFAQIPHIEQAEGVFHAQGGIGHLVQQLARAVERQGVQVRCQARATWRPQGAAVEVSCAGDSEQFDALVCNVDPLAVVPQKSGQNQQMQLALSGYVLWLRLPQPVALAHHTVIFAADYRREFAELFRGGVPNDATFYLCYPAASDATMAGKGSAGLYVMVNTPPLLSDDLDQEERRWQEIAAPLRQRCLAAVRQCIGSNSGGELQICGECTPVDLARLGAPRGSIYGFLPHGRSGPLRRPRMQSPWPGIVFVGGGTHPGGGVPLTMLSGQYAAQKTERYLAQS